MKSDIVQIGMVRVNPDGVLGHGGKRYRESLFYIAPSFNIQLLLFSPKDIDYELNQVDARYLENGEIKRGIFPLPKIIENSYYVPKDQAAELRKRSYMVRPRMQVGKRAVNEKLALDNTYNHILIPTIEVNSIEDIINEAEKRRVIIKQVMGMEGKSVMSIEYDKKKFHIIHMQDHFDLTEKEFKKYYDDHIHNKGFILQPFIESKTKLGEPFDVRVSIRRGANGEFMHKCFARIGSPDGVISNWSGGGYTMQIDVFLYKNYGEEAAAQIKAQLDKLGKEFPVYYNKTFHDDIIVYDMGLDVGIAKERDGSYKLWMFELNLRDPSGNIYGIEEQIAQCQYFRWLHEKLSKIQDIKFIWPIEPSFKATVHDYYYCNLGKNKIEGLTHNNKLVRKKCVSSLKQESHRGFDIIARPGTQVLAVASGKVIAIDEDNEFGRSITIQHDMTYNGKPVFTQYMYLQKVLVKKNERVQQGKIIALSGYSGGARIPNLYFRVFIGELTIENTIDPLEMLPSRDFSLLPSIMVESDKFFVSSTNLYNSLINDKWNFRIYAQLKRIVSGIAAGTTVELLRKEKDKVVFGYENRQIEAKRDDIKFIY